MLTNSVVHVTDNRNVNGCSPLFCVHQFEGYDLGPGGSIPADAVAAEPSAQASPGPRAAVTTYKIRDLIEAIKTTPLFQDTGNARGSIQFPAGGVGNGETIIRLFETVNLSTVAHESGHYFLTVMQDLAARGDGSAMTRHDVAWGAAACACGRVAVLWVFGLGVVSLRRRGGRLGVVLHRR